MDTEFCGDLSCRQSEFFDATLSSLVVLILFPPRKETRVQSDQERRTILAVGLSLLVYMVYLQWFSPPISPVVVADDVATEMEPNQGTQQPVGVPASEAEQLTAADADATVENDSVKEPVIEMIAQHDEAYESTAFSGSIDSTEGALRTVSLKNYTSQPDVTPLWEHLFSSLGGKEESWEAYSGGTEPEQLLSESGGFVIAGLGSFESDHRYRVSKDGDTVVAKGQLHDGIRITKRYQPGSDPHVIDLIVRFENQSNRTARDLWVGMADASDGEDANRFANVIRPFAYVDEDIERVDDLSDLEGEQYERFAGPVDWFGMGNKYFMSVLLPQEDAVGEWVVDRLPDNRVGSFYRLTQPLDAGASREVRFLAYVGPKDIDITSPIGNNLDASVEFGIFGLFAKILLLMLKFFYGLVGNWGVAIILLTMSIKAVFFPLMQKQFVSSKRMQAIQPELKALKEKYKDNQQLQTQMTMQLFKENNVNPMSGCLPMIIQMPVWFALYNVMLNCVEIYGTQFLYLKDLTEADPTGVLPLLVTVLMVLQQKLMPMGSMDPMQRKMMRLMPVMFGIFMFTFPAGLVLYFSVNNVLTIAQQWYIYRKPDDDSQPQKAS